MRTEGLMFSRIHTNKKGNYLVEAAISLPVFMIAVMVMSSVILMYACIEDCNFIAANELRRGAAEAAVADTAVAVPYRLKKEMTSKHSQIRSAILTDAGIRTERWGVDELIAVRYSLTLGTVNPLGIRADAHYDLSLVTRAYVGRERNVRRMTEDDLMDNDSVPVFIFPKRGEKYHSEGCGFLRADSRPGTLNSQVRKKYKSCPLCRSGKAADGTLIYYFPSAGEDYHLPGCTSLQRNFVEIDKETAIERGYCPCSKCGG